MKTTQINLTVGFKVPVGYGHVRFEITEFVDLSPDDDRDQVLNDKRRDITKQVYDHAVQMRDRLASDLDAWDEQKGQ